MIFANKLFGPDVGALKGKTTRRGPPIVDSPVAVDMTSILEHYGEVTLCVDLMYVNKMPLLVTLSPNIKFGTMEAFADRKETTLLKSIKGVISLYRKAGFKVTVALMDGEFMPLRGGLAELGIHLNETSRDEHVGDVERYIRTVKEQMRAIYNTLPFQKIPARLVIEMAKTAVFWLNAFPVAKGVSQDLSPRTILTGQQVDYKRHCRYQFGEYVQTHEEHNNSMNRRTVGAIALRPVGNGQVSFYFLSVTTGRVLNRLHATALPMPDDVIDKLHRMARQQKSNPGLVFADRNLNPDEDDDDDDDETYQDNDNDDDDDEDNLSYNEEDDNNVDDGEEAGLGPPAAEDVAAQNNDVEDGGVDDDVSNNEEGDEAGPLIEGNDDDDDEDHADIHLSGDVDQPPNAMTLEAEAGDVNQDDQQNGPILQGTPGVNDTVFAPETPGVTAGEDDGTNEDDNDEPDLDEISGQGQPTQPGADNGKEGRYNLRSNHSRSYNHQYTENNFVIDDDSGIVMTTECTGEVLETPQMSLKAGLRAFGDDGAKAVQKEMKQLHHREVMIPVHKKNLTYEQRKEALAYLMFLKRKRCGKIKGRGCADGRKQRAYIAKEDLTAPTVSTEAVFLTAVIDALENRDIAVLDVPGAFMQANIDELVHVRFTG